MSFDNNLYKILERHQELSDKLGTQLSGEEFGKTSKEYSDLSGIVSKINEYMTIKKQMCKAGWGGERSNA